MINYLFTYFPSTRYEEFIEEENFILSTRIIEIEPDNVYTTTNRLVRAEWYVRLEHDDTKDDNLYRHFYRKWRLEKEDDEYIKFNKVQSRSYETFQQFEEGSEEATRPPCPPEG